MRTRLFSLILALFAVLLPSAVWADDQGYVELRVTNGKTFDASDVEYKLTFLWGNKPTTDELDENGNVIARFWGITDYQNAMPCWVGFDGYRHPTYHYVMKWDASHYNYAPHIITAELTDGFTQNCHPYTMLGWFSNCTNLTTITGLENLDTSEVTSMEWLFGNCGKLESFDISNFRTPKLTDLSDTFRGLKSITYLDLRNFDVSNVINASELFYGSSYLKGLNLSTWNMPNVHIYSSMFQGLLSLEILDISNLDTRNVSYIEGMFTNCPHLKSIYVGENWNLENINRDNINFINDVWRSPYTHVFLGCSSLVGGAGTSYSDLQNAIKIEADTEGTNASTYGQRVAIAWLNFARPDGGPSAPGLLTSTKAFAVVHTDGNGVKTLYLCNRGASEVSMEKGFKPASFDDEDAALTSGLTVIDNLSTMGDNKWNLHALLTEAGVDVADIDHVVIEKTFAYMRPTTCESWFSGMSKATFDGLENLNTTECTSMKDMFRGTSISSLDFSTADLKLTFKTSKVTDMSGMFADCTSLTTLDLSSSNFSTANVTTMKDMFSGCSNLKYTTYTDANDNTPFNIDMFNTLKVTDMSGMFRGCAALAGLLNLNRLATENVTDMSEMFQNCTGLTTLQLGGANTKSVTAADRMFQGCTNLEAIKVNLIWDMQKGQSTAGMFDGCNKLTGQNGSKYITYLSSDPSNAATGKYAVIDDDATPGYLTEMVPVVLDLYADGDNEAQIQSYGATGQKINSVRVHRTFTAGQWTTLCLPFDMTAAQVTNIFGISSGDLLTLSRYNRTSHAVTYTAATEIKAGVPYLIKPSRVPTFKDDDGNTQYGFAVPNRTISAQTSNVNSNGLILKANYSSATITPGTSEELYTLKAGQSTLGTDLSSTAAYITPEENHVGGLSAYFMLYTADYVTVTMRNSTLDIFSCNYDLDFTDSHLKAWIASAFTPEGNGGKVVLTRITDVPAGTGVVITTTDANSLTDNVPIGTSNIIVRNLLVGTPDGANFTPQMNGNTIYVVSKSTGSIGNPTRGGTMGAGLGWLAIPTDEVEKLKAANGGQANIRFVFEGEDSEATGIEIVEEDAAKADGIYYNLNGQRVTAPTKGIYIKDGKKVYVK